MSPHGRLDDRLRRSAEDVRTRVARQASAPPIDRLHRRASPARPWALAVALLLILGGGAAITFLRRDTGRPHAETQSVPHALDLGVCQQVAALVADLAAPPRSADGWRQLRDRLGPWEQFASDPDAYGALDVETSRRLDRFVLLADLAAAGGANGELLPADVRAAEAAAVGRELVASVDDPACSVPTSSTEP